jgi:DNA primase
MQSLQSSNRSISDGKVSSENRGFRIDCKANIKHTIDKANSIDILQVFRAYNINLTKYDKKCSCPFHIDKTPSFFYYDHTNSWVCFSCKKGGGSVQFVAAIEKISNIEAADKLLNNFSPNPQLFTDHSDYQEKQETILEFSIIMREFIHDNINDPNSLVYAEKISFIFDSITSKHSLDNDGLKLIIKKLKTKLQSF